jgi:hypothetical protein
MADRYKVTVEEDNDGSGFMAVIMIVALVIGGIVWVFTQIWWVLLIVGIVFAIWRYNKKQKKLLPTRCPKCNKNNALEYVKTEVISKTPTKVTVISKGNKKVTDTVDFIEYTHRKYEKCKFCGTMSFSDTVKDSL